MAASESLPTPEVVPAPDAPAAAKDGKSARRPILLGRPILLLLILLLILVAAVGGWFYVSHRRPPAAVAVAAAASVAEATHSLALEPFLVNLADSADTSDPNAGSSYLRVVMVLRVADPPLAAAAKKAKEAKPKEGKPGDDPALAEQTAELRDTALGVLMQQQPERLLSAQGKELLKQELLAAFHLRDPEARVKEVLFTEFLVQR